MVSETKNRAHDILLLLVDLPALVFVKTVVDGAGHILAGLGFCLWF